MDEDGILRMDLLVNDADADGDALSITDLGTASHGTITRVSGGTIEYRPEQDFAGSDEFSYAVADGWGGSDTATVTVTIANVNDAPEGRVIVRGVPQADQMVLTAFTDTISDPDGLGPLGYQWMRDGVPIDGADEDTYALQESDRDVRISVNASYTDGNGTLERIASGAVDVSLAGDLSIPMDAASLGPASLEPLVDEIRLDRYGNVYQALPTGAELNNGNFVAVWLASAVSSNRPNTTEGDVFSRLFMDDGRRDFIRVDDARYATDTGVVPLADGGYALSWTVLPENLAGYDPGIWLRPHNEFGGRSTSDDLLVSQETTLSVFETLPDGRVILVTEEGIRHFDPDGASLGDTVAFTGTTETHGANAALRSDGLITSLSEAGTLRVFAQDGTPQSEEISTGFSNASVHALNGARSVIVAEQVQTGAADASDLMFQVVDRIGSLTGSPTTFDVFAPTADEDLSVSFDVLPLDTDQFLLVWTRAVEVGGLDYRTRTPFEWSLDLVGQVFDIHGNPVSDEIRMTADLEGDQQNPRLSLLDAAGEVALIWENGVRTRPSSDNQDALMRVFDLEFAFTEGDDYRVLEESQSVDALAGHDTIVGSYDADTLFGGAGDDQIFGSGGDDALGGSSGDDTLSGGGGHDRFFIELGMGHDRILDFDIQEDQLVISEGAQAGLRRRDRCIWRPTDGACRRIHRGLGRNGSERGACGGCFDIGVGVGRRDACCGDVDAGRSRRFGRIVLYLAA